MIQAAQFIAIQAGALALLVFAVWALIDALRAPEHAFTSTGKQSKRLWLILTGVAAALSIIVFPPPYGGQFNVAGVGEGPLSLLGIAAIVVTIIYHVSIRPAVAPYRGKGGGSRPKNTSGGW